MRRTMILVSTGAAAVACLALFLGHDLPAGNARADGGGGREAAEDAGAGTGGDREEGSGAPESTTGGTIRGRIRFEGERPAAGTFGLESEEHRRACGVESIPVETIQVSGEGGVRNVVITLERKEGNTPRPRPMENVLFDQRGCVYLDHVMIVPAGSSVRFTNSDDTGHNVKGNCRRNPAFNDTVPAGGHIDRTFEQPERVRIECSIHPWMNAWLIVADTPYYAVSDANGDFSIADIPPGTYTVRTWHESKRDYALAGAEENAVAAGGPPDLPNTMRAGG